MYIRILMVLAISLTCVEVTAAPTGERYIIQFAEGGNNAGRSAVASAGAIVRDLARHNAVAAHVPATALAGLRRNPNILLVEPDPERHLMSHLSSGEVVPYGIPLVQANLVTDASAANRKICIIDSGYDINHADLPIANVTGTDDRQAGYWDEDAVGHGTHVSGTIAAIGGNTVGVVGVLPGGNANLHIVRVFGEEDTLLHSSDLVAALDICLENGANVINMSLGGARRSNVEARAFRVAYSAGVLSFAAAGNDGDTSHSYPASYETVVSVAAIDANLQVASFSQRTSQVELSGPGVSVLSTLPMGTGLEGDVTVGASAYDSIPMEDSPHGSATGPLVNCDLGLSTCGGSNGAVCLMLRGDITFADKVLNCQAGGGVAAIIYNNEAGSLNGTLGGVQTTIPSVGVSDTDGASMLGQPGASTTVTVVASDYASFDGTSMATPHVAGVAALVWSHHPTCSNQEIRNVLTTTALNLGIPGRDDATGYGLVQAGDALSWLDTNGCSGGPAACPLLPRGALCDSDSDCCSNKCKGRRGAKTCK